ncbi:hypothetical protein SISNIDRAFT_468883 [Sistotremastrum niveocremeum HHB9708]|uniref:Uncharacterized protein n=1 Tax=Sistotremastrum niveocremeum HHB9708 TaxID=1314777 RepID=A0A164QRL3_9AGAM|nr:hypothetical protein SISNIDRAFT_468883 [Sistotremastrum niveocremeum HHB9708]
MSSRPYILRPPISSSYSHLPHPTALPTVGCAHSYIVALRKRATTSVWLMRKHHNRVRHPDSPGPLMPLALPLSLPSTCPRSPPPSLTGSPWVVLCAPIMPCMWRFIRDWHMRKHANLVHVDRHGQASPALDTCGVGPTDRNLALVPSALLATSFRETPAHWLFDILGTITLDWQVLPGAIIVQRNSRPSEAL